MEIAGGNGGSINEVSLSHGINFSLVVLPAGGSQGEGGVATVQVLNGVPDGVEIASTAGSGGQVFFVASHITLGVGRINFGDGVEWLMDVTNIVDNHSKGK